MNFTLTSFSLNSHETCQPNQNQQMTTLPLRFSAYIGASLVFLVVILWVSFDCFSMDLTLTGLIQFPDASTF